MGKQCLKCGYKRKQEDTTPDFECPNCGAIYAKVEAKLGASDNDLSDKEKIKRIKEKNIRLKNHESSKIEESFQEPVKIPILSISFILLGIALLIFTLTKGNITNPATLYSFSAVCVFGGIVLFLITKDQYTNWLAYIKKYGFLNSLYSDVPKHSQRKDTKKVKKKLSVWDDIIGNIMPNTKTHPNSKMKYCKDCAKEVSKTAKVCPHCGVKNPGIGAKEYMIGIAAMLLFVWWIFPLSSSENGLQFSPPSTSHQSRTTINSNAWYEGGTLYKSTLDEYYQGNPFDQLATAADYTAAILKGTYQRIDDIRDETEQMDNCLINAAAKLDKKTRMKQKTSEVAAMCAVIMKWR